MELHESQENVSVSREDGVVCIEGEAFSEGVALDLEAAAVLREKLERVLGESCDGCFRSKYMVDGGLRGPGFEKCMRCGRKYDVNGRVVGWDTSILGER